MLQDLTISTSQNIQRLAPIFLYNSELWAQKRKHKILIHFKEIFLDKLLEVSEDLKKTQACIKMQNRTLEFTYTGKKSQMVWPPAETFKRSAC